MVLAESIFHRMGVVAACIPIRSIFRTGAAQLAHTGRHHHQQPLAVDLLMQRRMSSRRKKLILSELVYL